MKIWVSESERVKRQAGEEMVILLQSWKKRIRRYRIYRCVLCAFLVLSFVALTGLGYYYVDSSIPDLLYVRAGQEQSIQLGIPAKAELVDVSGQGESNIPQGAVTIDLNRPVTVKTGGLDEFKMQVKLFGFLPFKQVGIQVIEDEELIPVGVPVGIYLKTDGILVVGTGEFEGRDGVSYSPGKYVLKSGDYIQAVNGEPVTEKDDFIHRIENSGGKEVVLSVKRNDEVTEVKVKPVLNVSGDYKIGVWVRDNAQGVGTLTYIDGEGNFGALGHGINDIDTSTLMELDNGTLYQTEIVSIRKGVSGTPGEMTGMIVYSDDHILGDITYNGRQGIFGKCNAKGMKLASQKPLPIAFKQEIEEGNVQILCTVDGTTEYYDAKITAVHMNHDNINRGIELKITDPGLLEITGGIVQGMSGAPIIQNGKIVGAVTHVLVQDSTRGYGIFIENMLKCE